MRDRPCGLITKESSAKQTKGGGSDRLGGQSSRLTTGRIDITTTSTPRRRELKYV